MTKTTFARIIGINESKIRAYSDRKTFASEETINKILPGIKQLGSDLTAASL